MINFCDGFLKLRKENLWQTHQTLDRLNIDKVYPYLTLPIL